MKNADTSGNGDSLVGEWEQARLGHPGAGEAGLERKLRPPQSPFQHDMNVSRAREDSALPKQASSAPERPSLVRFSRYLHVVTSLWGDFPRRRETLALSQARFQHNRDNVHRRLETLPIPVLQASTPNSRRVYAICKSYEKGGNRRF